MKLATASSPRSGSRTGSDGGNFSVFDFDGTDSGPFRDKQSSKAMFKKAFGSQRSRNLKAASVSARRGKSTSRIKAKTQKQGRKSTKKSCQQVAKNEEAISPELLSSSDKIETDDSDSISEGDVSVQPALKKTGVAETLPSFRGSPRTVSAVEKATEVTIHGEALVLVDGIYKCSPCFTFSEDAIALTLSDCHSNNISITWPLKEISSFGSYFCQQLDCAVLKLALGSSAADWSRKKLEGCILFDKEEGHVVATLIRDTDWEERQRQITSLSDAYKYLWSPVYMERNTVPASACAEGFLTNWEENLDEVVCGRNNAAKATEEVGFSIQADEGRYSTRSHECFDIMYEKGDHHGVNHEAALHIWCDIVYPEGDHDAVTVTKNDFLLLSPEEFLSDTIIDFYIKYLQSTLSEDDRNRFYFFNSFFFRKLTEGETSALCEREKWKYAFDRVKRWTARVNIFEKDYLFIPIMRSAHWSLIVICHPGCVSTEVDEADTWKAPVILHLDSLEGCHTGLEEAILNYLMEAWTQKYGYHGDCNNLCCKRLSEVKFMSAKVPQQTNYSDCGLFLLHYVEQFVERACKENPLEFVTEGWFNPAEASNKRAEIQSLIVRLHAMELANRCASLDLPDDVALAVKNKHVSRIDALAIQDAFVSRFRNSLYSLESSEVVQDSPAALVEKTVCSSCLHAERRFCIIDTHNHHEHDCGKGENQNSSHPEVSASAAASELQGKLCSSQPLETSTSLKEILLCPSHAVERANNCVATSKKGGTSILSDEASEKPADVDINPNYGNFSMDSRTEFMEAYCLGITCDDHGPKTVVIPNNSRGYLRFQESESCDYGNKICAEGTHLERMNDDKINKSPVDSKQLDLALEFEMKDLNFCKSTNKKDLCGSKSVSDTDEENHILCTEKIMVEDCKDAPSSSVSKEQHSILHSKLSKDQHLKDELLADRNSEEDASLERKRNVCTIDSQCSISIQSNPCPLQEEQLWIENQNQKHDISQSYINDISRVDNTQYISSDEEPSTPKYQAGLCNDVKKMFEAVNRRRRCKRKLAEDIGTLHIQGRRPVTRSATKRKGLKLKRGILHQQGRKHESPIEVK